MNLAGVYILPQNVKNNFVENGRDGEGGIVLVSSLLSIKIFQSMFDEAVKYAEAKHWAGDGVHPSPHGASLMAHFWIQAVTGA